MGSMCIHREKDLPCHKHLASRLVPCLDHSDDGAATVASSSPTDHQTLEVHGSHAICWLFSSSELQQELTAGALPSNEEGERSSPHSHERTLEDAHQPRLHFSSLNPSTRDDFLNSSQSSLDFKSDGGRSPSTIPEMEEPGLDSLKLSEEKIWPFLLRFPISAFGICMGVGSQSILWKTLAGSPSTEFLGISPVVNLVLWCAAVLLIAAVSATYALKAFFYSEAIRREFYHPVRVNFFFAPWVACLFLFLGLPPCIPLDLTGRGGAATWYALMAPIFCLELKIYGQWMFGGRRRLSMVANPSNHLSIVGNFVGALLGASLGLKEGPIFFFSVGLAHYVVLLVTLYQRLPSNEALPKELHPVFFLFVAVPTVAAMAWAKINGSFDYVCRIPYFLGLFLYASLVVRINFFRGFRFSLAWWAYTFPMTDAAIATIWYTVEIKNPIAQFLAVVLSAISTLTMTGLLISTAFHAFFSRDLFPNDLAITLPAQPNGKPILALEISEQPSY